MSVARPAESRRRRGRRGGVADIFEGVAETDVQNLTECETCLRLQYQEPTSRLRSRRNAVPDVSGDIEEMNERDLLTAVACLRLEEDDEEEPPRVRANSRSRRNALYNIYEGIDEFSQQNLHNSLRGLVGNQEQRSRCRRHATPNIYEGLEESEIENLHNFVHWSNMLPRDSSWSINAFDEDEGEFDAALPRLRQRRNGMANIFGDGST